MDKFHAELSDPVGVAPAAGPVTVAVNATVPPNETEELSADTTMVGVALVTVVVFGSDVLATATKLESAL